MTLMETVLYRIYDALCLTGDGRAIDALEWYAPRSPVAFLRKLDAADPKKVARCLARGGSIEEAVRRVKNLIGYEED